MQGDNVCKLSWEMYFADSLDRGKYSLLKQQYEQMMPEPLQSHPSVCGFYKIHAAIQLFKFRQEVIRRVHDVNVLSIISNYMYFLNFSNLSVQVIQCFC